MPAMSYRCTARSLNSMLQAYIESKWFDEVKHLFRDLLVKLSLKPDLVSYNTIISTYCRMGSIDGALSMIDEISENGLEPNCVTVISLLNTYYKSGCFGEVDCIWDLMESKNVSPYSYRLPYKTAGNGI
ncbi:hypothetical protein CDL15_Pgr017027 [Punica granatum]|uniref:Uncharacterized protein n=1 Tax=Punica granatum TaxID=22663 RepID=A0A218WYN8_PUNGR|nr:hypothetical protein CDL15_Pgr017027 [Punica granatum]